LKILHILDQSLPLHSGYTFRSHNILRCQLHRGWQLVALTSPKQEESGQADWKSTEVIDRIRYYRSGASAKGLVPLEAEVRLMVRLGQRMLYVAEKEKPDLLHVHSPILNAIPAFWVGRKLGLPVVYEMRALWEDAAVEHRTYRRNSWKYKLVRFLETWVCRRADQVAVICQGLKTDLIRRGIPPTKLTVVFNGVDVTAFDAAEPDREFAKTWNLKKKKIIAFFGSFYRYEGLDLLIDAVSLLSRSDTILLLAGGGPMEAELKAKVWNLGLQSKVVFPGRIPHHRIAGVYALADVLVYPRYRDRQ
jgi:PEP-CTERM/exosortase A-associated glycosyltransferase